MKQTDNVRNTSPSMYSSPHERETVLQCTEQITRTIQNLCKTIQEPEKEQCVASGDKVKAAIIKLADTLSKVSHLFVQSLR